MDSPWQYIVLLGAVVLVAAFVIPRRGQSPTPVQSHEQSLQHMETALDQFMENMERDNEEIAKLVTDARQASRLEAERFEQKLAALEQQNNRLSEELAELKRHNEAASAASKREAWQQPAATAAWQGGYSAAATAEETEPQPVSDKSEPRRETIQTRYEELFRLYAEGKSIEMIAKRLGMNKGEVQLIIGLAKQEGAARD